MFLTPCQSRGLDLPARDYRKYNFQNQNKTKQSNKSSLSKNMYKFLKHMTTSSAIQNESSKPIAASENQFQNTSGQKDSARYVFVRFHCHRTTTACPLPRPSIGAKYLHAVVGFPLKKLNQQTGELITA